MRLRIVRLPRSTSSWEALARLGAAPPRAWCGLDFSQGLTLRLQWRRVWKRNAYAPA